MSYPIRSPRKLIEVALPLDAINRACAKEKSIRFGHPSTLHLWWARRPLAAARAVVFAQMVNDPGYQQGGGFKYGKNKKEAAIERKRLFKIIEDLVLWENSTNADILEQARVEIRRSWKEICELNKDHENAATLFNPDILPAFHDPFAGGGAIPLEAQRLGLEAYASDLNPVAVLINRAMIDIPSRFAGVAPVGPQLAESATKLDLPKSWLAATGLAEDVRRYGHLVREEAQKRIGHLYPQITVTKEMVAARPDLAPLKGKNLNVIAWLWARTVKSPNPAFSHVDVPLAATFILSNKAGKEAYIQPEVQGDQYSFTVKTGTPPAEARNGTKLARGANFACIVSGAAIQPSYIKAESLAKRMGNKLMAVVAEGVKGRIYLAPTKEMEAIAKEAHPNWGPDLKFVEDARAFTPYLYGLGNWQDLFTARQLVALTTFTDIVAEVRDVVQKDAVKAGLADDNVRLNDGGTGAAAYADSVNLYLALAVSKLADSQNALVSWKPSMDQAIHLFTKQAVPMLWDFAEPNVFGGGMGDFGVTLGNICRVIDRLQANGLGSAVQADAQTQAVSQMKVISTDPPYYDNVPYADLSDFFYVWLRRSLREVFPDLFATVAVPKAEELVAFGYRHGGKAGAEKFFLGGMTQAMRRLVDQAHPAFPVTIYYAFKQSESHATEGTASTGWETFLEAVIQSGFAISGTWPMRTELENRMRGLESNALASSIVLVCQKRVASAATISRREFLRELNAVLPEALDEMTKGADEDRSPVAPVDLSQSIIGPGMAVFSKYSAVLEADGTPMSVKSALQLINRFLAEDDFDSDTQFCLHWFEQHGWSEGPFGDAETLSRAKGTSVEGVKDAGVIVARAGKVGLLKWSDYPLDWDPKIDTRNPVWETLHHLIRSLKHEGETAASKQLASVRSQSESIRQLAYRLYTLCERQGWAEDARAYNELITSWTGIESTAGAFVPDKQLSFLEP